MNYIGSKRRLSAEEDCQTILYPLVLTLSLKNAAENLRFNEYFRKPSSKRK